MFIPMTIQKVRSQHLTGFQWVRCYDHLRHKIHSQAIALGSIDELLGCTQLEEIMSAIEIGLNISDYEDLGKYRFNHQSYSIFLTPSMWRIVESIIISIGQEEPLHK